MRVREIMTAEPVRVTPETLLNAAARLMQEQDIGVLPVVDGERSSTLVGIITDRDIAMRHVAAGHTGNSCKVREAMTNYVTTCRSDADVNEVMTVMGREQVRRIPIVDERGALVGVVSQADIVLHAENSQAAERTIEQISAP